MKFLIIVVDTYTLCLCEMYIQILSLHPQVLGSHHESSLFLIVGVKVKLIQGTQLLAQVFSEYSMCCVIPKSHNCWKRIVYKSPIVGNGRYDVYYFCSKTCFFCFKCEHWKFPPIYNKSRAESCVPWYNYIKLWHTQYTTNTYTHVPVFASYMYIVNPFVLVWM